MSALFSKITPILNRELNTMNKLFLIAIVCLVVSASLVEAGKKRKYHPKPSMSSKSTKTKTTEAPTTAAPTAAPVTCPGYPSAPLFKLAGANTSFCAIAPQSATSDQVVATYADAQYYCNFNGGRLCTIPEYMFVYYDSQPTPYVPYPAAGTAQCNFWASYQPNQPGNIGLNTVAQPLIYPGVADPFGFFSAPFLAFDADAACTDADCCITRTPFGFDNQGKIKALSSSISSEFGFACCIDVDA